MSIHRVNSVRIELSEPTFEAARREQDDAAAWAEQVLPGLLDEAFSGYFPAGQIVWIDKLMLDIGSKPWLASRQYWLEVIRSRLGKTGSGVKMGDAIVGEWVGYLERGYLSPGNLFGSLAKYEQFIVDNLEILTPAITRSFRAGSLGYNALARMLFVHNADFLFAVLRAISGLDRPAAELILQQLRKTTLEQPDMLVACWTKLSRIRNVRPVQAQYDVRGNAEEHTQVISGADKKDGHTQSENPAPGPGGMYAANAGLILLHPYLSCFFETLGFTEKGAFTDNGQRNLAVHTLSYLATGNEEVAGKDLLLEKILCGVAPEDAALPLKQLPAYITDECRDLLNAVIGNWPALKNSSPEALQEAFLQRPGLIRTDGEAIRLIVEKGSADVLLGMLPWGLSISRLPWLNKLIYIDWA